MTNAVQRKWLAMVTEWYESIGYLDEDLNGDYSVERHHVVGRKGKHNKIPIGHWFILPLPFRFHNIQSGDIHNVTNFKHNFTGRFGLQSELFKEMIDSMVYFGYKLPFGRDVIDAIMDTRK